jgi:multisubunit Na+/H+ antiporter MnhB subunit
MTTALWIFDILLALTLVGLAARALTTPDLFKAVVLFIAMGLLMAVAWTRLEAPDIALAEAAIGAGLTGALFLNALGQLETSQHGPTCEDGKLHFTVRRLLINRGPLVVLILALWIVLSSIVWHLPREATGLAAQVEVEMPRSGVTNPVTAVLLNFRGYDTLLEIGVLLLAVVGVWSLAPLPQADRTTASPGPVLLALVRILVPLIGVVAAYLLCVGTKAPGGAFQAGAVLSAAGVLLLVAGISRPPLLRSWPERLVLVLGFGGFLGMAVILMATSGRFLQYPSGWAGSLILLVETLLTLSIAAILVALFAGGPPGNTPTIPSEPPREDTP